MNLTPKQQEAAYTTSSVVVTAGAGTGKTHLLTERFLFYLQNRNISPLEIVAVTFTEKAAEELRSRIRSLIQAKMPNRRDILAELEATQISTIHALASRICAEFSEIAEITPDFQLLESARGKIWLEATLEEAISLLDPDLFQVIPYSLMKQCLQRLLEEPYTAKFALQKENENWQELIFLNKEKALNNLLENPVWQNTKQTLQDNCGEAGDKLEQIRQTVLSSMEQLETRDDINSALSTIDKIKVNVGSKKNWQNIALVKSTLKEFRDLTREFLQAGSLTLELSEADARLQQILPRIKTAYDRVSNYITQQKQQAGILTFSDLELYALKALQNPEVKEYYAQRWQVFLIDEFQDTNPTQAAVLKALTDTSELTIVGDIKQSIYGFRRADIKVFADFKTKILAQKGKEVVLSTSFRTHRALIEQINQVFAPLLGEMHQDLVAYREDGLVGERDREDKGAGGDWGDKKDKGDGEDTGDKRDSYIRGFVIEGAKGKTSIQRQQLEAEEIANRIQQALEQKLLVHDKKTQSTRPIEPGDFLIITRTWQPLGTYGKAIAKRGIPIAPAGGGNLLATREAKDGYSLIRFLSDPQDDLALVALLRSPLFSISDRQLLELAFTRKAEINQELPSWWQVLQNSSEIKLMGVVSILKELLQARRREIPSHLLQKCDRLTGYTAILANLPQGNRKLADWQGFRQLVQELEAGVQDIFSVARDLKSLFANEAVVARPPLEVGNSVGLMTIYAAKGLERPYLIVADLSKQKPSQSPPIYFDREQGVAIKSKDQNNNYQKPVLYTHLENEQKQRQLAEDVRVMYVALTRARDYLLLSGSQPDKGNLKLLAPGLSAAGVELESVSSLDSSNTSNSDSLGFNQEQSHLAKQTPPPELLTDAVGSGIFELPVTALTEYNHCPQSFWWQYLQGHPGAGEGMAYSREIGSLVHKALELNIKDKTHLMPFCEQNWQGETVAQALELVTDFLNHDVYKVFRDTAIAKEKPLSLQIGSIKFSGIADLIGKDWLLDYKSDRNFNPLEHRFQIWAYAQALGLKKAHIAYLRHNQVHSFGTKDLQAITLEAQELVKQIEAANYEAKPSVIKCQHCVYNSLCEFAQLESD